jgi:NADH-quinone oxidoreductase subunit A
MLKAYLPALIFVILGVCVGLAFTTLNRVLGPSRPNHVKREPYESGVPSRVSRGVRFGISFYLVGMMFILFDVEVILLYPAAVAMGESVHALGAIALFIFFLGVAFVYEWRKGSLDWHD